MSFNSMQQSCASCVLVSLLILVSLYRAMTEHKLHSLPVVDEENILLGVILAADVMQDLLHIVRNLPPAGEFIEDLSP